MSVHIGRCSVCRHRACLSYPQSSKPAPPGGPAGGGRAQGALTLRIDEWPPMASQWPHNGLTMATCNFTSGPYNLPYSKRFSNVHFSLKIRKEGGHL